MVAWLIYVLICQESGDGSIKIEIKTTMLTRLRRKQMLPTLIHCNPPFFFSTNQKNLTFQFQKTWLYTKSLVNAYFFYANFANMTFQKIPIPHLTRTME